MSLELSISRLSAQYGAAHTLRKAPSAAGANSWTAGSRTVTYADCSGRERYFKPKEIAGGIEEGDALITLDAASLPDGVRPEKGDRIAIGFINADNDDAAEWRQIVSVYPARVGNVFAVYKLQVRA